MTIRQDVGNHKRVSASSGAFKNKKSLITHYKKDDILKNRLDVRIDKKINSARK